MNQQSQYAFYGSLRRGMENYRLYEKDLRYIRTVTLEGFKMFSLTDYPYVVRTGRSQDTIVVELFRVSNPQTEQIIHQMELEADYIFSEVEIEGIKFGIYLFEAPYPGDPEVGSGDWSFFKGSGDF